MHRPAGSGSVLRMRLFTDPIRRLVDRLRREEYGPCSATVPADRQSHREAAAERRRDRPSRTTEPVTKNAVLQMRLNGR